MNLTNYKIKPNYKSGNLELIKLNNIEYLEKGGKAKADKTKIIEAAFPYDVYTIVMRYYNTNKKVAIRYNRKFIYNGVINFELQTAGTFTQIQTFLNMKAQEFTNKLLTK